MCYHFVFLTVVPKKISQLDDSSNSDMKKEQKLNPDMYTFKTSKIMSENGCLSKNSKLKVV